MLDGALRVPLEDCGGLQGWYEMLKLARATSADPDRNYLLDWFKAHWGYFTPVDPEAFDTGASTMRVRLLLDGMSVGTVAGTWLSTMPTHARLLLAETLYLMGADVFARPATPEMPETAPRAMESIMWWIRACEGEGLPLTAAGYLSPTILPGVIAGLGWEHEDFVQFGGKTEVHLHGILDFRETLMDIGLLKAQGKKLVATPTAVRVVKGPREALDAPGEAGPEFDQKPGHLRRHHAGHHGSRRGRGCGRQNHHGTHQRGNAPAGLRPP